MSESGFRSPDTNSPLIVNPLNLRPELPEPEARLASWRERWRRARMLLLLLRLRCMTRSSSVAGSIPSASGNSSGNLRGRETKRQCSTHGS